MTITWFNLSPTSIPLAQAEIEEVLKQHKIKTISSSSRHSFLIINTSKPLPTTFINRLGGTLWTAQQIDTTHNPNQIIPLIKKHLPQLITPKIKKNVIFYYHHHHYQPHLAHQYTYQLKSLTHLSYLNLKTPRLNQHQLQHTLTFIIVYLKNTYYLLKLTWYYPWETYIQKDKTKPFVQPTAGMLPHKIARIMVNLALNQPPSLYSSDQYLLDPFAGSGTILIEALDLGLSVIGIEKHPVSFNGLKQNLDHFINLYSLPNKAILYHKDAQKLHTTIKEKNIIAVATEPYLGPSFRIKTNHSGKTYYVTASQPNTPITTDTIDQLINNLTKLYATYLRNQAKILKPSTKVVIILPLFHFHNRFYRINLIDKKGFFDYTLYKGPFTVKSQKDLVVRRQIYILVKK